MKTPTDILTDFSVLIVEDDDNFRTQLAEYFRTEGFQILEAKSSSTACALIRERKPSLVLLDWDLQNHNFCPLESSTGREIIRACHEVDPLLPVIVMSGPTQSYDPRGDSLMVGADCFIQKPFAPQLLDVLLRRWMTRLKAEKNPFTQLTGGVIQTVDAVNHAYARAVVEKVGSVLQAAPKLGLSRQTVASYLASPSLP